MGSCLRVHSICIIILFYLGLAGAANLCEVACRKLVDVARLLADDFLGICFEDFAQIVWNIYLLCAIHWLCVERHDG